MPKITFAGQMNDGLQLKRPSVDPLDAWFDPASADRCDRNAVGQASERDGMSTGAKSVTEPAPAAPSWRPELGERCHFSDNGKEWTAPSDFCGMWEEFFRSRTFSWVFVVPAGACERLSGNSFHTLKPERPLTAPAQKDGWREGKPERDGVYACRTNKDDLRYSAWHDGHWCFSFGTVKRWCVSEYDDQKFTPTEDKIREYRPLTPTERAEYERLCGGSKP